MIWYDIIVITIKVMNIVNIKHNNDNDCTNNRPGAWPAVAFSCLGHSAIRGLCTHLPTDTYGYIQAQTDTYRYLQIYLQIPTDTYRNPTSAISDFARTCTCAEHLCALRRICVHRERQREVYTYT